MSSNVVVVTVYISCSNLEAAKEYIDSYRVSQLVALTELLRTFRMAGLNILLFGDMNAYTLSQYGFLANLNSTTHCPRTLHGRSAEKHVFRIPDKIKTEKNY